MRLDIDDIESRIHFSLSLLVTVYKHHNLAYNLNTHNLSHPIQICYTIMICVNYDIIKLVYPITYQMKSRPRQRDIIDVGGGIFTNHVTL